MKTIVFGAGNVGAILIKKLKESAIPPAYIVRSNGVYDLDMEKIADQSDWKKYADTVDVAFICTPSVGKGEQTLSYMMLFLEKGKRVITCEKASIAHNWDILKPYIDLLKYNASVGGGTKMLKEISKYNKENIKEIKAVVNGTLNYISDGLAHGKDKDQLLKEVLEKGYAEPGAVTFEDVVKMEINDVLLKATILANHSGLYYKTVEPKDIKIEPFSTDKRCIVKIYKEKLDVGFIEDNLSNWLPNSVNNTIYINGTRHAYGPGAGGDATVETMLEDLA